ncbi:MAG TPA: hypothetical protein VK738_15715 [Terriglobales bacterium]|jgi:hypothetical protein|nr:hypothetical protein [Terriglobales bacterium]
MKIKWTVFVLLLTASVAFAQVPAASDAAASGKKSSKSKKASSPLAPKTAKPKATKKANPAPAAEKPAEPGTEATAAVAAPGHKRDPFISPVEARLEGMTTACSGGKRCLAVNEVILRGIVKSANGMIAVVENSAQKTYFLHENDPIYNGFVEKITPDSVIFKEHYLDNLGHDSQREVVKTVNAPVV